MVSVLYTAFDVFPSPKGSSTHITYFTGGLIEAGYQVSILTPARPGLPAEEEHHGARLVRLPVSEDPNYLMRALEFADAVMHWVEHNPEINIAHFRSAWDGFYLAQAKDRFGYRTVFEVNGLPSIELKYHYPGLEDQPVLAKIKAQEQAALAAADAIVCVSGVTRDYLASLGARPEKITVIPNGVDVDLFAPQPQSAGQGSSPTLVYIGTLADWQGLGVLIEAMQLVLARHEARLRIVGPGRSHERKEMRRRIRKMGLEEVISVEEALPYAEIPALLAQADMCIAPLTFNDRNVIQGCCPIKVIEYMACGRPLVASNLPVVRELVREGLDGLLCTPGDPASLARCILQLLEEPALGARLAQAAAERARDRFSWRRAQQRLLEVYAGLRPVNS